jgi:transposase
MEGGRERVRKCVRRAGIRVVRTSNQCAERRVRRTPLDGMPWRGVLVVKHGDDGYK